MAEDAFVTDFEHIMADDITENVRFIMYDSTSGKTASASEVSKYMMKNIHVDTTLTEEGSAADAKAVGGALAKKADTKGRYEDIVAGGAEQLMADGCERDSEPYLFRPAGGSADVGNREYLDKIVGGTVGWNQLAQNGNFASVSVWRGITGGSYTVSNNVATITTTTNGWGGIVQSIPVLKDHKYLHGVSLRADSDISTAIGLYTDAEFLSSITISTDIKAGSSFQNFATMSNCVKSGSCDCGIRKGNDTAARTIYAKDYIFFDLTALFNPTIADYIYNLEQSQAGAGVAWFRRYFPEDYYPYDAGTLKSVQTSAHKTYDADGNVVGTYPLDSSLTLRGVPKLVDGKLAFDGDVYPPSGEVQRRYGVVDLGTLGWRYNVSAKFPRFISGDISSAVKTPQANVIANIVSTYVAVSFNTMYAGSDKSIAINIEGNISISDSAYTDAASFKAAMSGVQLVYELATPTTETADEYEQYQKCDPSGTEAFVTDSIVPVGHETRYPHDLKKKIETAPDSPSTDGTYLMKRSGGKNAYMALPSTPSANGAYVLTVTVSSGSASYSWTKKE